METPAEQGFGAQVRRQRGALLVLGALGAILLGIAIGALIRLPLDGDPQPDPNAVDIGFLQDMSVHHTQAVEMAGIALLRSTDTEVRRIAYDILTTQQSQVGRMQGWLQLWDQPVQAVDGYMGWMAETGGHGHGGQADGDSGPVTAMPGMATREELNALRDASSPAADTLFLSLMLRHHQGGMPMMEYAAEHAATTAVRTLAAGMVASQRNESDLLTTMLTARGGTPLPLN
ncbi:DUF305 domain-containing protein [Nocardia farcinica]|uniref:DUF305 domain-containing protein n=1 Tax=Nocardia farcinica TaxID=37329 RepID=UPI0018934DBE|nr:DUF305 domain-containing protein [Nocardia farcinica]MBF6520843.1 DUF305 domain-containing protein [Nocardia farcinica]